MAKGTEGYERNIPLFTETSRGLDFQTVCKDFVSFLPDGKGNVLDIGSGAGQNAAALDKLGFNVTAVDPMRELINSAQEAYSTSSVTWLIGSLPNLKCLCNNAENFDFVLIEAVWHHLNEIERLQAVAKLFNITKEHGKCAISLRNGPAGLGSRVYVTDADTTIKQFENHGFKCVFKILDQDSILPKKEEVKWSRLVFTKQKLVE